MEKVKKQKIPKLKEIKFSLNIAEHDFQTKINKIKKLFNKGCQIRITIEFNGREINKPELGIALIEKVKIALLNFGNTNQESILKGKTMSIVLSPFKEVIKKVNI